METLARTRKLGGSIIVTLPREIVREDAIREGELVTIEVKRLKKSGFGVLKGISKFSEEDRARGQLEE